MQYDAASLALKLAIILTGSAAMYFIGLWAISKYVPDFSDEDEEV